MAEVTKRKKEKKAGPIKAGRKPAAGANFNLLLALGVVAAVAIIAFILVSSSKPADIPAGQINLSNASGGLPPGTVVVNAESEDVRGDRQAKVWVVEFGDFQCSFTAKAKPVADRLLADFNGSVALVWKHFPLDSACNPVVSSQLYPGSCKAAEASECASEQGRFWEYHDKLLSSKNPVSTQLLKQYATDLGLDTDAFDSCLDSGRMAPEVRKDIDEAILLGIPGTPTFFIEGRAFARWSDYDAFRKAVEDAQANGTG